MCTKVGDRMSELKELRVKKRLTQADASAILGVSLRSYKSYENDPSKTDSCQTAVTGEQ